MLNVRYLIKKYLDYQCPKSATIPTLSNDNRLHIFSWPYNSKRQPQVGYLGCINISFKYNPVFIVVWVAPDQQQLGVIYPYVRCKNGQINFGSDRLAHYDNSRGYDTNDNEQYIVKKITTDKNVIIYTSTKAFSLGYHQIDC